MTDADIKKLREIADRARVDPDVMTAIDPDELTALLAEIERLRPSAEEVAAIRKYLDDYDLDYAMGDGPIPGGEVLDFLDRLIKGGE